MKLHHFTSRYHFDMIVADGFIELACSDLMVALSEEVIASYALLGEYYSWELLNRRPVPLVVSPEHRYAVPLTRDGNARHQSWAKPGIVDKTEYRITVDVPLHDVFQWDSWSKRNACDENWRKALSTRGHLDWFLVERRIDRLEWTDINLRNCEGWKSIEMESLVGPSGTASTRPPSPRPAVSFLALPGKTN